MSSSRVNFLHDPFPESTSGLDAVKQTFLTGVFVGLFLFVFNPFGLQNMPAGVAGSSLVFGLITFVLCLGFKGFVVYCLKLQTDVPSWTFWKWLVMVFLMVFIVAIGNFIYLVKVLPGSFGMWDFPKMLKYTFLVGAIPLFISGLIIKMRANAANVMHAKDLKPSIERPMRSHSKSDSLIELPISSGSNLVIAVDSICVIESMQNYLSVYHWDEDKNQMERSVIRSTLKSISTQFSGTKLFRCHRSFMVNLQKVEGVEGNAQGLKLTVDGIKNRIIPVSRSYIKAFKAAVDEIG